MHQNHNAALYEMNAKAFIYEIRMVILSVSRLCCLGRVETRNGKTFIDSFSSFLAKLRQNIQYLLEWHILHPAHRLEVQQELVIRPVLSQAQLKISGEPTPR